MLRKEILIGALTLTLVFAGSSAVLAGEGDYSPTHSFSTSSMHNMESMQGMNNQNKVQEGNKVAQCQVVQTGLTHKDDRSIRVDDINMMRSGECKKLDS